MKKKFLVLLAAGLLAAPMAAMAGPVTWYLQGVTFNDGGAATGSFIYDADANAFSGIDITTTAGTTRAGSRYTFRTGIGTDAMADFLDIGLPVIPGTTARFILFLASSMSNAGGASAFSQADEFTCLDFSCTFASGTEAGLFLRQAPSQEIL